MNRRLQPIIFFFLADKVTITAGTLGMLRYPVVERGRWEASQRLEASAQAAVLVTE